MVFYRKYRPQKIEELDSEAVRNTLFSVLSNVTKLSKKTSKEDLIPHAFLFTGPKGLGKTSTARIVAKVINCTGRKDNKSIEPCNECEQCISISNGNNLDVFEIDAASNRGIDEIRDLREKIKLSPVSSYRKIYIIDEVHMLTTEAFNALLKTLEEPPRHAAFILCTTESHKVPETILSRCFHISFRLATKEELARSLTRIAKGDKIEIDKDAINLVAQLSGGSFRDGAKIIEEMALVSKDKKITKELIEKNFQISNISNQVYQMIELLIKKDAKNALILVSKLVEQGVEAKYFIEQLIAEIHLMILVKAGVKEDSELRIKNLELEIGDLKNLIEILTRAYSEIKFAVLDQLPLELAIIEWCGKTEKKTEEGEKANHKVAETVPVQIKEETNRIKEVSPNSALWQKLLDKVKLDNHSVAGVLRGCRIENYSQGKVVISTNFKFHKERLDDRKAREVIEKALNEIEGKKVEIEILLKEKNISN